MIDRRHWAQAYLMYMILPLLLMYPLFLLFDAVFGQVTIGRLGVIYLVAAGIVLGFRIVAAHAHDELWREGIAAVIAVALFFIITHLWAVIGIVAAGYLVYDYAAGRQQQGQAVQPQSQSRHQ